MFLARRPSNKDRAQQASRGTLAALAGAGACASFRFPRGGKVKVDVASSSSCSSFPSLRVLAEYLNIGLECVRGVDVQVARGRVGVGAV